MDLKGKVAVITGGSSGIGLSIVKKLLLTEIKVINLFELKSPSSTQVFNDLEKQFSGKIELYPCDVTNTSQLKRNFDKVFEKYKAIDILINNAGSIAENMPERVIDTNYKAVVLGSLILIDRTGKHKGGNGCTIINIASIAGLMNHVLPIYCSSKHAVVSFTRTMKTHFNVTGVRMIAICPGHTNTQFLNGIAEGLDFVDTDGMLESFTMQSPDNVAAAFIKVIGEGQCGDVWVVEEDQPAYIVKASHDYRSLRIN